MTTLQNILAPMRSIGGVGDFGRPAPEKEPLPPIEVSEDLANQYDTEEMHAQGWRVVRGVATAHAAPTPLIPAPKPEDDQ